MSISRIGFQTSDSAGRSQIKLPLWGLASCNPQEVTNPAARPLWILASIGLLLFVLYLCLRLTLLANL
jgi:hypothetical protein